MTGLPHPAESLQDTLRKARAAKQANTIERLPLPGFGGRLVGRYRLLSWAEQRAIAGRNARLRDEAQQELYTAADNLIAACDGIEAVIPADADEQAKAEAEEFNATGHKLNTDFAEYLGLYDRSEETPSSPRPTARQALFLIIPQEVQVVVHAGRLMEKQETIDAEIDEGHLGESDAAS